MLPLVRAQPVASRASSTLCTTSKRAAWSMARAFSSATKSSVVLSSGASRNLPASFASRAVAFNGFRAVQIQQARGYADKKEVIVKVPTMMDSVTEGTLKQWSKNIGDFVKQDEEVVAIETDKVDISVNAPVSGVLKEIYAKEDDTVNVGADLFKMEAGEAGDAAPAATEKTATEKKVEVKEAPVPRKEEVAPPKKEEAKPKPVENAPKPADAAKSSAATSPFDHRSEHRVKMPRIRTTIASRLKESQNTAASLTTFNEVDMTNLMDLRSTYKDLVLKEHGVKLGFMSAFTKAVCHAVKAVPAVNAMIEGPKGGDTIVYRDYVDVSVAVATPKGLVTPVIRNAEKMTMVDIEKEIAALGVKARENKITLEDLAGGTFTISNGGVFGSLMGTPIINMPQSAILGMHAIKDRPIAINGEVKIRPMMYLALTYDHRLIDGREAVTFLVKIKEAIEDPRRLLLDV